MPWATMENDLMKTPYLIQRISSRYVVGDDPKNFDAQFSLDYMGSSEFEWGAIPRALKSIRAKSTDLVVRKLGVTTHDGLEGFVISVPGDIDDIIDIVTREIADPHLWCKQAARIHGRFNKDRIFGENTTLIGWWDIENDWLVVIGSSNAKRMATVLRMDVDNIDAFK